MPVYTSNTVGSIFIFAKNYHYLHLYACLLVKSITKIVYMYLEMYIILLHIIAHMLAISC